MLYSTYSHHHRPYHRPLHRRRYQHHRPDHPTNTYKRSQHIHCTDSSSYTTTIASPTTYSNTCLSIRRTLFVKISSAISFAEPKLLELVPTLTDQSNFAPWSSALKYALGFRNPANVKSVNACGQYSASTSTTTNKPTTTNTLLGTPIVHYNNLFNN